jgi:hypothetical protein
VSRKARVIVVLLGVVAAVGVAAAVGWRVVLRDTAEPASVADAVERYRAAASAAATSIPPGVYVYATTGFESISALGGTRHDYPARSTITVGDAPCGMQLRWDVLETRTTSWTVCTAGTGGAVRQQLDGWTELHVFFGQDDRTDWHCSRSPWLTSTDATGTRTSHLCDGGDTTQVGTVDIVGSEVIAVGGSRVETVHVRLTARENGAARGPLVEERWVESETGLPVRLRYRVRTENASPIGDVAFTEQFELRLLSLRPRE